MKYLSFAIVSASLIAAPAVAEQTQPKMSESAATQMTEQLATQSAAESSRGDITVQMITLFFLLLAVNSASGGSGSEITQIR